ncbi:hypothetical protein [Sedimentitalea nanhaiensis]|uniref:Uncharacterized protein n=1 Tax=Sedimentitalea nanhaiensis TaxID=999627 RepID=A0A1I7E0J8_9RHOB|nr:hypothetical protein [Sedimentitalea nanhaiensis]SFU17436.1 hypothetical protein SAMN05216236_1402 [Sedimentitalea nanhaiensis]
MFIPYGRLYVDNQGGPQQQSHFSGTQGQAMLVNESNGRVYYEAGDASYLYNLAIQVSYDATGVTITNTSGETWSAAHEYLLEADMGSSAPLLTDWAPKTPYVDCKPTGASPMLGSASTSEGPVAFLDIHGNLRGSAGVYTLPVNVDKGPWQVS